MNTTKPMTGSRLDEGDEAILDEEEWLRALTRSIHVSDPASIFKSWCGYGAGEVTRNGVVSCQDCVALLMEHPQYYNQLRVQGLRTVSEARHEAEIASAATKEEP